MKARRSRFWYGLTLSILAGVGCLAAATWIFSSWKARVVPAAGFLGFTNASAAEVSVPRGTVDSFSRLSPRKAEMIQRWFEAGTNAAVCNVTNRLSCVIDVYWHAPLCFRSRERAQLTLLILPIAGRFLKPGEAATLKVLMPPNTAPCRIEFCYHCLR